MEKLRTLKTVASSVSATLMVVVFVIWWVPGEATLAVIITAFLVASSSFLMGINATEKCLGTGAKNDEKTQETQA